jgi:hypothetical protein
MAAGSGSSPRLWDREAELAEISRALARVRGGEAGLLVLRGLLRWRRNHGSGWCGHG